MTLPELSEAAANLRIAFDVLQCLDSGTKLPLKSQNIRTFGENVVSVVPLPGHRYCLIQEDGSDLNKSTHCKAEL